MGLLEDSSSDEDEETGGEASGASASTSSWIKGLITFISSLYFPEKGRCASAQIMALVIIFLVVPNYYFLTLLFSITSTVYPLVLSHICFFFFP